MSFGTTELLLLDALVNAVVRLYANLRAIEVMSEDQRRAYLEALKKDMPKLVEHVSSYRPSP